MTKVLIIEDEPHAEKRLLRLLGERSDALSIRVASNGIDGLNAIAQEDPDIVLLDIEMPGISGLKLADRVMTSKTQIIFQTAHAEFALDAFEKAACDYLLKPFSRERFHQAFDRAFRRVRSTDASYLRVFFSRRGGNVIPISEQEVSAIVSRHHYTYLQSTRGEFIYNLSLEELEKKIDPARFFRMSRHCIVNGSAIKKISREHRRSRVHLADGTSQITSRNREKAFRDFLRHFSLNNL